MEDTIKEYDRLQNFLVYLHGLCSTRANKEQLLLWAEYTLPGNCRFMFYPSHLRSFNIIISLISFNDDTFYPIVVLNNFFINFYKS